MAQAILFFAGFFGIAMLVLGHGFSGAIFGAIAGVVIALICLAFMAVEDKSRRNRTDQERAFLDQKRKECEEEERKRLNEARELLDKLPPT